MTAASTPSVFITEPIASPSQSSIRDGEHRQEALSSLIQTSSTGISAESGPCPAGVLDESPELVPKSSASYGVARNAGRTDSAPLHTRSSVRDSHSTAEPNVRHVWTGRVVL